MITIKITCPNTQTHGEIGPDDIVVYDSPTNPRYSFQCPYGCGWHERPADPRTVQVLTAANVTVLVELDPMYGSEVDEAIVTLYRNVRDVEDLAVW